MPNPLRPDWPAAMRAPTAALYLDVSETHFRTVIAPTVQPVLLGGRTVAWRRADLDAWLAIRAGAAASSPPNPWDAPPDGNSAPAPRP